MLRHRAAFSLIFLMALPVATASAQALEDQVPQNTGSDPPKDRVLSEQKRWYGDAIIGTDAVALGLGVLGVTLLKGGNADAAGASLFIGGGLTYFAASPIVHGMHGRSGAALGSVGLRLAVPIVGTYLGAALAGAQHCGDESCQSRGITGGVVGFGFGMLAASIVDISLLAYEPKPNSTATQIALVPSIDPKRGSAGLNLVGAW